MKKIHFMIISAVVCVFLFASCGLTEKSGSVISDLIDNTKNKEQEEDKENGKKPPVEDPSEEEGQTDTTYPPSGNVNLYILSSNGYWKDGVKTDLPPTVYFSANAIAVSKGSVYIAGFSRDWKISPAVNYIDFGIACYWKDGVKIDLPPGTVYSSANAITVSEGSVYIAGSYNDDDNISRACYWKDGVKTDLPATSHASANAIAVSGGSVYIAGHYRESDGPTKACYWKDGVKTDVLPDGTNISSVKAIAVSEGSVYIAGYYYTGYYHDLDVSSKAFYWKDGVKTDLPGGKVISNALAIAVSEGSVYIAGMARDGAGPGKACYWKDGVKTELSAPGGLTRALAIAVSGGSVYIAGDYDIEGFHACYWKDGVRTDLPEGVGRSPSGIAVIAQ